MYHLIYIGKFEQLMKPAWSKNGQLSPRQVAPIQPRRLAANLRQLETACPKPKDILPLEVVLAFRQN